MSWMADPFSWDNYPTRDGVWVFHGPGGHGVLNVHFDHKGNRMALWACNEEGNQLKSTDLLFREAEWKFIRRDPLQDWGSMRLISHPTDQELFSDDVTELDIAEAFESVGIIYPTRLFNHHARFPRRQGVGPPSLHHYDPTDRPTERKNP